MWNGSLYTISYINGFFIEVIRILKNSVIYIN